MSHTNSSTCAVCPAPLPPRARTGRPAVYCSRACQAKAYRARTAEHRRDEPRDTAPLPKLVRLPKRIGDGSAADRVISLTIALVHRAELAAGAIRHGRPVPEGADGLDGSPETIERIAADLVATIRGAAPDGETSRRDETTHRAPALPAPTTAPEPKPRRRRLASVAAATARQVESARVEPQSLDEPPARVTRTVDMSADLGDGYTLVQLESSFESQWFLRLHGEIIGGVTRFDSLSGRTVSGWEARHHTFKVPCGLRGSWRTRGLAAAAVADAHQRLCGKPKGRNRRSGRAPGA